MDSPAALREKSKDELIALALAGEAAAAELQSKYETALSNYETARSRCDAAEAEIEKLHLLLKQLKRALYGRRSEKIDVHQLQLGLEDIEQALGAAEAAVEAQTGAEERGRRPSTARRNRGSLPRHLPREEIVIEPEQRSCPCCGGTLHVIGEDVAEQLDMIPARLKVKVIRRPRYGCRACEGAPVQAPAPARIVDGGMPSEAVIAHVVISKYLDHPRLREGRLCRSTARPRSMPVRASSWTARPWPTGSAAPPGG